MPAIPPANRSRLEGSGTGGEGGVIGGGLGPDGMINGIIGIRGIKASQGGRKKPVAPTTAGGAAKTGAAGITTAAGIMNSRNTGCFFPSF
jgi:hypothetical protein